MGEATPAGLSHTSAGDLPLYLAGEIGLSGTARLWGDHGGAADRAGKAAVCDQRLAFKERRRARFPLTSVLSLWRGRHASVIANKVKPPHTAGQAISERRSAGYLF